MLPEYEVYALRYATREARRSENMVTNRPYATAFHIGQMLDAYRTLERLAPSPHHIVPGHDPHVMKECPAPKPALEGIAVRLDAEPIAPALTFAASGD